MKEELQNTHVLSYGQQGLWYLNQVPKLRLASSIVLCFRIKHVLDTNRLHLALTELCNRHRVLKVNYVTSGAGLRQSIRQIRPLDFSTHAANNWSDSELKSQLYSLAEEPFDLASDPLMRASIISRGEEEHLLVLSIHHSVIDLLSCRTLLRDLGALYSGLPLDEPPDAKASYFDFCRWQRNLLNSAEGTRLQSYWLEAMKGYEKASLFESATPSGLSTKPLEAFSHQAFQLGQQLSKQFLQTCRTRGVTPFTAFLVLYQVLLYRHFKKSKFLVGVPVAGRPHRRFRHTVGYFVNMLPIRADMSACQTIEHALSFAENTMREARRNQHYPFPLLVEKLAPIRKNSETPLLQTCFTFQKSRDQNGINLGASTTNVSNLVLNANDLTLEYQQMNTASSPFPLSLTIAAHERKFSGLIEFSPTLLRRDEMQHLCSEFQVLVEEFVETSQRPIRPMREGQINESDSSRLAHTLFEDQVSKTPNAVAIEYDGGEITYGELNAKASHLAARLRAADIGQGETTAVLCSSSANAVIAMLATLKIGAVFLPIDPSCPIQRQQEMMTQAKVCCLLTDDESHQQAHGRTLEAVFVQQEDKNLHASDSLPQLACTSQSPAYIMYTSGTSGNPKGVVIPHRGLTNHILSSQKTFAIEKSDRVLQFHSLAFDASIEEIFPTLCTGATLILEPACQQMKPTDLVQMLEKRRISILSIPTSYWHLWVNTLENEQVMLPKHLRLVIIGGEAASMRHLLTWRALTPEHVRWINTYGVTEATVTSSSFIPDTNDCQDASDQYVSIGTASLNTQLHILDENLNHVCENEVGELYIGGAGVALGYINNEVATKESFIADPYSEVPGTKLYRTGDRVRRLSNGNVAFIGRLDRQLNIRGYRIEPQEIELALENQPAIREAAVIGEEALTAYVAFNMETPCEEISTALAKQLPSHMLPNRYIKVPKLPRTSGNKIDYSLLRELPTTASENVLGDARLETGLEKARQLFAHTLPHSTLREHDSFFENGGYSLLAMELLERLHSMYRVNISLEAFLKDPTIYGVAKHIDLEFEKRVNESISQKGKRHGANRQLNTGFEIQAERNPNAMALVCNDRRLTYGELAVETAKLASKLVASGMLPGEVVPVLHEKSWKDIVAVLAILKAGGAYCPVSSSLPLQRRSEMYRQIGARRILSCERCSGNASEQFQIAMLSTETDAIEKLSNCSVPGQEKNMAYVIYTSGSTGTPKGVALTHSAVLTTLDDISERFQIGPADTILGLSSLSFDLSVFDIFGSLSNGATLVLPSLESMSDPSNWIALVEKEHVSIWNSVPQAMKALIDYGACEKLNSLRLVLLSGDTIPVDLAHSVRKLATQARIVSLGGATEAGIWSIYHEIDDSDVAPTIPYGRALAQQEVTVLDSEMNRCAVAQLGEIYIGGNALAAGYIGNQSETTDKFVICPHTGNRYFRSGDRGRFYENGEIEILGRVDNQLKVSGYRIEPREVEISLEQIPGVRGALVKTETESNCDTRLVAFILADQSKTLSYKCICKELRTRLPEYMIPRAIYQVAKFPLTENNKIDRQAILHPLGSILSASETFEVSENSGDAVVRRISEIWERLLPGTQPSKEENFFEVGGHSLLALELLTRIEQEFSVRIPLSQFLRDPTPRLIAQAVRDPGLLPTPWASQIRSIESLRCEAESLCTSAGMATSSAPPEARKTVLLTGATGFLGMHLLHELLQTTSLDVVCLVRAERQEQAHYRLTKVLQQAGLWQQDFEPRTRAIAADCALPSFGLPRSSYQRLAKEIDAIYHSAANLSLIASYQELFPANVSSTIEILKLASTTKVKAVYHISSLGVVPYGAGRTVAESDPIDQAGMLYSGYSQTKWVAEHIVRNALHNGLPGCIFRPGLIVGRSARSLEEDNDLFRVLLTLSLTAGVLPRLALPLDMADVSFVSKSISRISNQEDSGNKVFHLCNPRPVLLQEVGEELLRLGQIRELIDYRSWWKKIEPEIGKLKNPLLQVLEESFRSFPPDALIPPYFDCSTTRTALQSCPIDCPSAMELLLSRKRASVWEASN